MDALQKHLLIHKEKSYSCKACQSTYKNKETLAKHIKIHENAIADPNYKGKLWFGCIACPSEFKSKWSLYYHALFVHGNPAIKQCHGCGKAIKKTSFKMHSKCCDVLFKKKCMPCKFSSCREKFENYEMMVGHIIDSHGSAAYDTHKNSLMEINAMFGIEGDNQQTSQDTCNLQTTADVNSVPDLKIKDASQNKIYSHVTGNEKIRKQSTKDVDSTIVSFWAKHLKYDPVSQGNGAVDNGCYNFTEPNLSLESDINLDLELLCNFFGNGHRTATRI